MLALPALMLALGMALAGCTNSGNAVSTPTPTPAATVTPTPTPSPTPETPPPPVRPEAMATPNADGAAAAARHFMDLYTYSRLTGDPSLLFDLSSPECLTCSAIVEQVNAARDEGKKSEGYAVTIHEVTPTELVGGESFTVRLRLTEGVGTTRDRAGVVVSETAAVDRVLSFGLRWHGEWTVEALGVETAG
ncbi:DUF6318 family protein [Cellulomonas dongxiuzhuiae]|uniref:DUF6318 family protein n=1 Tax=Cellulomonas dongxiuzhuiae TaxID=2819979 RepID=UPI001AAF966A|nr:DUF6318 family protein [Cellulomonas dongxiuzhuiae]MBO3089422.1 hypothetical protein [Cellulomonas dongxiuzhuiae]